MRTTTTDREAHETLRWLLADPVRFARGILHHDVWLTAARILRSVKQHRRTAVKACHASSKTFTAAEAALWWVTAYPDGIVITTAPTWTQVEKLLWGEIHKATANARIEYPSLNQTELRLGPNNYAIGLSTDQGVRFQGWHGRILIILDEAPGVHPDIWEAIEGIRAGGDVHLLALGNPTIAGGPFYDAFTNNRAGWQTFTISAFDTPNLAGLTLETLLALPDEQLDIAPRPYLTGRRWVVEKFYEWGKDSPAFQSRVLGQFPQQSEDALLSLAWLEAARNREPVETDAKVKIGVDVAGPGEDETVATIQRAGHILAMYSWAQPDPRGALAAYLEPWKGQHESVNVDAVGIGYYLAMHLQDLGYDVRLVNVGEGPRDSEKYTNLKAELYWGLRMRFQDGAVAGLTDETTISQLSSIRYKHNARGQIVIESKEEMRKRGVKSPDRAESLMLALADPPTGGLADDDAPSESELIGEPAYVPGSPRRPVEKTDPDLVQLLRPTQIVVPAQTDFGAAVIE